MKKQCPTQRIAKVDIMFGLSRQAFDKFRNEEP